MSHLTRLGAVLSAACVAALGVQAPAAAAPATMNCTIQTRTGHYVTAVGGGGKAVDAVRTDARKAGPAERFVLVPLDRTTFAVRTAKKTFITAVGGGNRAADVIRSTATKAGATERMSVVPLGGGWSAIRTPDGHFLTAVGGGGRARDVVRSTATKIGPDEKFKFTC